MTALLQAPTTTAVSHEAAPGRLAGFGPNWFASVMGTGIIANAAMLLPLQFGALHAFALVVWVLAAVTLIGLLGVSAAQVLRHPDIARGHHRNLAMAPFYGAPAMALLTVGSGALLVGQRLIGLHAALILDAVLWTLGTAGGLVCAVAIPYLMFTSHRPALTDVYGSWLMAVVPPMVSASAGAGLIPHVPAGQARLSMELACGGCFGLSALLVMMMLPLLWARLAFHGVGAARMVPTVWIVLGPLGQSITAALLLAHAAGDHTLAVLALVYGVAVWGLAVAWMVLATLITVRCARVQLPFSLTWWSFTFPLGTVVTGTSELALHTHADVFAELAALLFCLLLVAWAVVAARTVRGTLSGTLFAPISPERAPRQTRTPAPV